MKDLGIHIIDEKFNAAQSREMQLLIRIAPKRISYAIINARDNRLLVLYDAPLSDSIEDTIEKLSADNNYLRSTFSRIKVSVQTLNFTFIPAQYFSRDDLPGYEKLIQATENTKTFVSAINSDSVKCVVALELTTIAPLISLFSEVRLFSQAEPLIEIGLKTNDSTSQKLILQVNDDSFEACLTTDDKLIFYNIFSIENADDFNYYLLMLMQQANVVAENTSIILAGNIAKGDENYQRIEKYFTNIRFAESSQITSISTTFEKIPNHKYFSLISLLLCE